MKITKRQLKRIIREERQKLLSEVSPANMSMHDAAEHYEKEAKEAVGVTTQSLVGALKKARLGAERHPTNDDEIYIMTGDAEGITIKVLRRGR